MRIYVYIIYVYIYIYAYINTSMHYALYNGRSVSRLFLMIIMLLKFALSLLTAR